MGKGSHKFSHGEKLSQELWLTASAPPVSVCWIFVSPQLDDITYLLLFVLFLGGDTLPAQDSLLETPATASVGHPQLISTGCLFLSNQSDDVLLSMDLSSVSCYLFFFFGLR